MKKLLATLMLASSLSVRAEPIITPAPDTGSGILTKLAPVDGEGSGLDADTVDGMHLTSIVAAKAHYGSGMDWNTLTTPGTYGIGNSGWSGASNHPSSAYQYGVLTVTANTSSAVVQTYTSVGGNPETWIRGKYNAADWSTWRRQWNDATAPSPLNKAGDTTTGNIFIGAKLDAAVNRQWQGLALDDFITLGWNRDLAQDHLAFRPPDTAEALIGGIWTAITVPTGIFTAGGTISTWAWSRTWEQVRLTWNDIGYRWFDFLYVMGSIDGNSLAITTQIAPVGTETFEDVGTITGFNQWPGHASLRRAVSNSGKQKHRYLFTPTWTHASNPIYVYTLRHFGGYPVSGATKPMTWDISRNVTFNGAISGGMITSTTAGSTFSTSVDTTPQLTLSNTAATAAKLRQHVIANGASMLSTNAVWNGSAWSADDATKKSFLYAQHVANGIHEWRVAAAGTLPTWTTALWANEANAGFNTKLGIGLGGTTAPTYLLDVRGTSNDRIINIETTTAGAWLRAAAGTAGYAGIRLQAGSGGTLSYWTVGMTHGSNDFVISNSQYGDASKWLRITDATGKLTQATVASGFTGNAHEWWVNGVHVASMSANGIEQHVAGSGMVLKSPSGTRYKITVSDAGALTVVAAP